MGEIYGILAVNKLLQIAAFDDRLFPTAVRTMALLAGYADKDGACFPSISKMANSLAQSRQSVIRQINILEEHGYIHRKLQFDNYGRQKQNIYIFNCELAQKFQNTPEIYSRRNRYEASAAVTLEITPAVTSEVTGAVTPEVTAPLPSDVTETVIPQIAHSVTQSSYTNKPLNIPNEEIERWKPNPVANKQVLHKASAWLASVEFCAANGITREDMKEYEALATRVKKAAGSQKLVRIETNIIKEYRERPKRDAYRAIMLAFEAELKLDQQGCAH